MIASFNQISTPMLVGGGFAVLVLNTLFMKWFLGKIQSEPLDEPEPDEVGEDAEALVPESAIRTSAGVPRSRPLQPVDPPAAGAEAVNPIRLTSLAESSAGAPAAAAPSAPPAAADPVSLYAPKPSVPSSELPTISTPISLAKPLIGAGAPTASLTTLSPDEPAKAGSPKPDFSKADQPIARVTPSLSPLFAAPEKQPEADEGSPILPPLNFTKRASAAERPAVAPIMEQGRAASADLILNPTPGVGQPAIAPEPAAGKPAIPLSSPPATPAADLIFVDKPTQPLSSMTPPPAEIPAPAAKDMPPSKALEPSKPAGADLIAIPPVATSGKPPIEAQLPSADAGDARGGGLMLIPSSPEASPVTPQPEKAAGASGGSTQASWKTRLLGRPRIFLPTGGSTAPATEEAAETVTEGSLKEQFAELKPSEAQVEPAKQADEPSAAMVEADIPAPAPVSAPAAETPSTDKPAAEKPAQEKAAEDAPAILTPSSEGKSGAKLGEIAESEILVPSKSEPPAPKSEALAPSDSKPEMPALEAPQPPVDLASLTEIASTTQPAEQPPAPKEEKAAPVIAPVPEVSARPKSPAATPAAPVTASAPPEKAAPAPNLPAPIRPAEPVMNQKESTAVLPSGAALPLKSPLASRSPRCSSRPSSSWARSNCVRSRTSFPCTSSRVRPRRTRLQPASLSRLRR